MRDRTIVIRNIYVMLAYAFRTVRQEGNDQIEAESFDHLHDLFAEILARGVGAQVKRGLHRDYLRRRENLSTVRGRIDITRTAVTRSMVRGQLVCEFDEYEADTPHNQALKAVIILMIRRSEVATERKDALRRLLPYLDEVTHVPPASIRWGALTYHRSNADYRLLLGVCELVVRGLLPTEDAGDTKLSSWLSQDAMSRLYENFLREYYAFNHPELSPRASTICWDHDPNTGLGFEQLPRMLTDVTLRSSHRTLIIDAKYYGKSMQSSMFGKETIRSSHLYQILAYTKNFDVNRDGSVSGLLLYARTDAARQPDLDAVIQGNRIGARTLDLNRPWVHLRTELDELVIWLKD